MYIKHLELEVPDENPFRNCKLDREQYAIILSKIVNKFPSGFVLALNSEWGTGKTTFLKMWEKMLVKEKFRTVYFNAWENDFEDMPLVALLGELKSVNKNKNSEFNNVLRKGSVLAKNLLPGIFKAVANRYIDSQVLLDIVENSTKGVTEIFEAEVNDYKEKKQSIADFKVELQKFATSNDNNKPIIFFIDELDRCRPNYAVSILEQIKHFFSVPGIVFVLSIDKEQLGNAVKGVYNSNDLNATEYLRRFIDIEYSLPEPDVEKFCKYMYDFFEFPQFFKLESRRETSEIYHEDYILTQRAPHLLKNLNISLRQIEKLYSQTKITLSTFGQRERLFPDVFFFLIVLKNLYKNEYNAIQIKKYTIDELQDLLLKVFPLKNITRYERSALISLEAFLLTFYRNYIDERRELKLYTEVSYKPEAAIKSVFDNSPGLSEFSNSLSTANDALNSLEIFYLLKKINLTQNFYI